MTDEKPFVGNEIDYRYVEYLRANATREGDCLICHLSKANNGYCMVPGGGYVHRLVYTVRKGPIPEGLIVRHTCDTRSCIEDNHIILGTHQDNTQDMISRGRGYKGGGFTGHGDSKKIVDKVLFDRMLELQKQGYSQRHIGAKVGVSQHTVRQYLVLGRTPI